MSSLSTFDLPVNKKPIVIIGAGGIVKDAHLPAYKKADFEVSAIYDLDTEKAKALALKFEIPTVCIDLKELVEFAQQNDCVYDMALPASVILSVLANIPDGSGVLIQKPMGENITQAEAILGLCRKKKLVAGINFQLRHAPYVTHAKKLIDQGAIGELHDIDVRMNVYTPWHLWDFLCQLPRVEILYHSIHYIDMIRYFLGEPKRVFAKTTKHPNMRALASTRSSIIMDYGDLVRANINTNHGHNFGSNHQESYFTFEGTEGAIKITVGVYLDYPKGLPDQFEYISLKDGESWKEVKIEGSWFPDAFIGPMAGLMCKTENPAYTYINSVEDAIHTMDVVEKCYESSENL
ncbi:Gfo/Idh/MocA family oxidoreductase [Reichenbachiella sp. MALMAid0571]|uniref:Gfo/Idh/MocA family protein n=1 Tax=Reichenbachiella sp. MALMAid0571 TaxID=3143939 RepID=UPI0032DE7F18